MTVPNPTSEPLHIATDGYLTKSRQVDHIVFHNGTEDVMRTSKQWDHLDRLTQIEHERLNHITAHNPATISSCGYRYNLASQRYRVGEADSSYWIYAYDNLAQLTCCRTLFRIAVCAMMLLLPVFCSCNTAPHSAPAIDIDMIDESNVVYDGNDMTIHAVCLILKQTAIPEYGYAQRISIGIKNGHSSLSLMQVIEHIGKLGYYKFSLRHIDNREESIDVIIPSIKVTRYSIHIDHNCLIHETGNGERESSNFSLNDILDSIAVAKSVQRAPPVYLSVYPDGCSAECLLSTLREAKSRGLPIELRHSDD